MDLRGIAVNKLIPQDKMKVCGLASLPRASSIKDKNNPGLQWALSMELYQHAAILGWPNTPRWGQSSNLTRQ